MPLTLYHSKGSSALAALILLEEVGATYTVVDVPIATGAHRGPAFLALSPKGRVPVLACPEGVLTENPAILEYIAATHPAAACLPAGAFAQAQARALCAYLCATVHVAFAHARRGARWARDPAALEDMRRMAPAGLQKCAHNLEEMLPPGGWALGAQYSFCDPYLFLMDHWLGALDVPIAEFPKLAAHARAMRARPATQAALTRDQAG